jgi:hypothetical protein
MRYQAVQLRPSRRNGRAWPAGTQRFPYSDCSAAPLDWCASSPFAGHSTRQFVSPMWNEGSLAGESALCQCCAVTVRLAQCDACCLCQGPAASVRMLTATTLTWSDTAAAHEVSSSAAAPISAERASMAGRNTAVPLLGLQCRPPRLVCLQPVCRPQHKTVGVTYVERREPGG